jgi:hypothetical protein
MDLSSYAQKVRGNLQSLFFPSSSSSSFILYDVARDKRGDTKDFEASNTTTQKRVVDFDAKQQKLEFSSSFVSSQKEFHANEAQKNTQRAPLVDGLSIVLFDRRRDFDERRLCDDDVNDDTFEQKKKKKKNDDDAVVPPARDHQKRDIIENDNQSATTKGRL